MSVVIPLVARVTHDKPTSWHIVTKEHFRDSQTHIQLWQNKYKNSILFCYWFCSLKIASQKGIIQSVNVFQFSYKVYNQIKISAHFGISNFEPTKCIYSFIYFSFIYLCNILSTNKNW